MAKSFSARTKGRATRTIKKALIPGYGNKGLGILHPKKALYNKVYHKTSFSCKQSSKVHTFSPANAHFFSASFLAGNGLVVS